MSLNVRCTLLAKYTLCEGREILIILLNEYCV